MNIKKLDKRTMLLNAMCASKDALEHNGFPLDFWRYSWGSELGAIDFLKQWGIDYYDKRI